MRKNVWKLLLVCVLLLSLALFCVACAGKPGADGKDGVDGAVGAQGPQGEKGDDGVTPLIRINPDSNEWEVSTDNGSTWTTTNVQATGSVGLTGPQGASIEKVEFDSQGRLIITLTDDTVLDPIELPQQEEHQHTFGDWITLCEATTCEAKGVKMRICPCGGSEAQEIVKGHISTSALVCSVCGERVPYHRDGEYIYFGEYPQTIKAEDVTITETTDSRGYYLGSDNAYYAKVTADPYESGYTFSDGSAVTGDAVYYFKVEPILWRIIAQGDETALILCDSIIANKAYDNSSSNNYAESDIRAWLNDQFYNTAFTALEQELILTTTVDNSVASTGYSSNQYDCENTEDKVFLLSYAEVTNSVYGLSTSTSRKMQTSDYSRATGAYMNTSTDYYGNGCWWLRSPDFYYSFSARSVVTGGDTYDYGVDDTSNGVVPALQIRLQ